MAIVYAPAAMRADWAVFLTLDARLGAIVRGAREPMIAQLKLAWWRDRLGADPATWPRGEPLLAALGTWGGAARGLTGLVDGWEALLAEPPLDRAAITEFADGRVSGLAALAARLGAASDPALDRQARRWAWAELALHEPDGEVRARARELLATAGPPPRISRSLRPLALLGGLSARALRRGTADPLDGPGALLAAIRLGFTGG